MTGLTAVFERLTAVFARLGIPFLVGGSVAGGYHGLPRQTNDIDLLIDLAPASVPALVEALSRDFYIDEGSVFQALAAGCPFNVIHLEGSWKFDVFTVGDDPFAKSEMARRQPATAGIAADALATFPVATAEDMILAKLVWFRKGGEVSDRQWGDLLGIVNVQKTRLDRKYLDQWAPQLSVADLLLRLLP